VLRYRSDVRTIAYLVVTVALVAAQWRLPEWSPWLYVPYLFMCVAAAVISHNHNHLSIWKSPVLNQLTSYVISILYGHPAIAWVPTHNQNHHKFNNQAGDTGRSPALFKGNHLLALLVYPTVTGLRQQTDIKRFMADLWARDRRAFWAAVSQYVVFYAFLITVFAIDWRKALFLHFLPQQFALGAIQTFNYVQHVEADEESEWNHSRNFVSPVLNALLFNNGYHTVHHLKPGVHWSQTPELHKQHAAKIHPNLLQQSWWGYMARTFLLRPFTRAGADRLDDVSSPSTLSLGDPRSDVG
jgi:beta-carotene hydroxylase